MLSLTAHMHSLLTPSCSNTSSSEHFGKLEDIFAFLVLLAFFLRLFLASRDETSDYVNRKTCTYISPSHRIPATLAKYVNDNMHSCHKHSFFRVSRDNIHATCSKSWMTSWSVNRNLKRTLSRKDMLSHFDLENSTRSNGITLAY